MTPHGVIKREITQLWRCQGLKIGIDKEVIGGCIWHIGLLFGTLFETIWLAFNIDRMMSDCG